MSAVLVELNLPKEMRELRLPAALHERLQELLDRQDRDGKLMAKERREALALAKLAELLSVMRLRAEATQRRSAS